MGNYWIILIPFFVSLWGVWKRSIEWSFVNVYIPVLLLCPLYDTLKLPSMPPLTFADTAIIPIGVWWFFQRRRQWRWTRMDLWMAIFIGSLTVAVHKTELMIQPVVYYTFIAITSGALPYIIGKSVIEQGGLRIPVMKRTAFILAVVAVVSLYEFRMGFNPFHVFWWLLLPYDGGLVGFEQLRWGFTRVSGPYPQSETTGMVFCVGVLFAYWLYRNGNWEKKFKFLSGHPFPKRGLILTGTGIGMFINQARGPYLGFIFGFLIARTVKTGNWRAGVKKTLLVLSILGAIGFVVAKHYTTGNLAKVDTDQGDAIYRSMLLQYYWPIVQQGGLFGYGLHPPSLEGLGSIDNAYLYFALVEGYVGASMFILLVVDSLVATFRSLRYLRQKADIEFVFCIAGCLAGLALCLATVYLTAPVLQIVFLLMGWSQSIGKTEAQVQVAAAPEKVYAGYRFRRVFT